MRELAVMRSIWSAGINGNTGIVKIDFRNYRPCRESVRWNVGNVLNAVERDGGLGGYSWNEAARRVSETASGPIPIDVGHCGFLKPWSLGHLPLEGRRHSFRCPVRLLSGFLRLDMDTLFCS